jgi:hypothetical protein
MKLRPPALGRWARRFAVAAVVTLAALQLFPVERTNPPVHTAVVAPPEVLAVLRRSCFDCHSHETRWPWYSYVNPVAWYVADHVHEARGELNFSAWPAGDPGALDHAFEEIQEVIEEGEMPLTSYLLLHWGAGLSEQDRRLLVEWAAARD